MKYCRNCGAEESDPCRCGNSDFGTPYFVRPEGPFTFEEKEIWDLLVAAHDKFIKMAKFDDIRDKQGYGHASVTEWTTHMNHLQDLLIFRIVKRDYPNEF